MQSVRRSKRCIVQDALRLGLIQHDTLYDFNVQLIALMLRLEINGYKLFAHAYLCSILHKTGSIKREFKRGVFGNFKKIQMYPVALYTVPRLTNSITSSY